MLGDELTSWALLYSIALLSASLGTSNDLARHLPRAIYLARTIRMGLVHFA